MNKKLIFEYMVTYFKSIRGWDDLKDDYVVNMLMSQHHLNGNDKEEAMKIMEYQGDWVDFVHFVENKKGNELNNPNIIFCIYQNFFNLMSDWLEAKKEGVLK